MLSWCIHSLVLTMGNSMQNEETLSGFVFMKAGKAKYL